jgi:hypothetical protein
MSAIPFVRRLLRSACFARSGYALTPAENDSLLLVLDKLAAQTVAGRQPGTVEIPERALAIIEMELRARSHTCSIDRCTRPEDIHAAQRAGVRISRVIARVDAGGYGNIACEAIYPCFEDVAYFPHPAPLHRPSLPPGVCAADLGPVVCVSRETFDKLLIAYALVQEAL